jgi:SAM-dependent methyltransferase
VTGETPRPESVPEGSPRPRWFGHRSPAERLDYAYRFVRIAEKGREFYPGLPLATLDLWHLTPERLAELGLPPTYDLIVCAGNVMLFLAEGTEPQVVRRLSGVLRPGGRVVFGFFTGRDYDHDDLDRDAQAAGWVREHRFATWQVDAVTGAGDWAVSVYRSATGG